MEYSRLLARWEAGYGEAYTLSSLLPPVYPRSREREAEYRAARERYATPLDQALGDRPESGGRAVTHQIWRHGGREFMASYPHGLGGGACIMDVTLTDLSGLPEESADLWHGLANLSWAVAGE